MQLRGFLMLIEYTSESESAMPGSFGDQEGSAGRPKVRPSSISMSGPPGAVFLTSQSSQSSHQTFTVDNNPSSVKQSAKVHIVEILCNLPLPHLSQIHAFLHHQHSIIESWCVCIALQDQKTMMNQSTAIPQCWTEEHNGEFRGNVSYIMCHC